MLEALERTSMSTATPTGTHLTTISDHRLSRNAHLDPVIGLSKLTGRFRLLVIGLAPSHPIVQQSKAVASVKFQSEHRDFTKNVVRGSKKKVRYLTSFTGCSVR
jgi:hypothetical protein